MAIPLSIIVTALILALIVCSFLGAVGSGGGLVPRRIGVGVGGRIGGRGRIGASSSSLSLVLDSLYYSSSSS